MIYSNNTYDITNDISTYTRTDFKSVYDTSRQKWYMLNNLNNYEEYGIYGDSFDTYYPGKLVIVNDHEYEWDGTEWDDLGPYVQVVTGAVRDVNNKGYIKFPITVSNISSFAAKFKGTSPTTSWGGLIIMSDENLSKLDDNIDWRFFFATTNNLYYDVGNGRWNRANQLNTIFNMLFAGNPMKLTDLNTGTVLKTASNVRSTGTTQNPYYLYFGNNYNENDYGTLYDLVLYSDNAGQNAIAHYVPTIQNNVAGFYDTMNEVFIAPNGGTLGTETETRRPKDYDSKVAPTITSLWGSKIFRNSNRLYKLLKNEDEQAIWNYKSEILINKA